MRNVRHDVWALESPEEPCTGGLPGPEAAADEKEAEAEKEAADASEEKAGDADDPMGEAKEAADEEKKDADGDDPMSALLGEVAGVKEEKADPSAGFSFSAL